MIEPRLVKDEPDRVRAMLKARKSVVDFDTLAKADANRRAVQVKADALRAEKNAAAEKFGQMKRKGEGDTAEAKALMERMKELDACLKGLEVEQPKAEAEFMAQMLLVPNFPHESVPPGTGEADNKEVKRWGEPRKHGFKPKPHWEIGEALGLIDLARASKIAGSRFPLFTGRGARLMRGLTNFMLDLHTKNHGYTEVSPPVLANLASVTTAAQYPIHDMEMFRTRDPDELYLIPTAEVSLANIHREEILEGSRLPLKYVAYTLSFRREAGSHGKDVRGLIRNHQFDKVELFQYARPEDSIAALEEMLGHSTAVLEALEIPYRVMLLCPPEASLASHKTYDPEAWMPAQDKYREIASVSTCSDFQARRGQIRFKRDAKSKTELVHTLNGSGLAVGRTFVALLENFQNADGSVAIPERLRPYMDGLDVIR